MIQTRIKIAKPDIVKHFDNLNQKVFKNKDLSKILSEQRGFWRLTKSMTNIKFVEFLINETKIKKILLSFETGTKKVRYLWGNPTVYEIASSLAPKGYFCHFTAMYLHKITQQVPKTIYLNSELYERPIPKINLVQDEIDEAFSKPCKETNNITMYKDFRICVLNGMFTGQLGVIEIEDEKNRLPIRVTDLERTLIDISVRPIYAGGVFEVLNAFRLALGKISVNRLTAKLKKINYIYPYHQVIGFYLERAGYPETSFQLLNKFKIEYDFYLTHQMKKTDYSDRWRLYFPKGM